MYQDDISINLTYPWDATGYCPEVTFYPKMTETGFHIRVHVKEQNPKRVMTEHFQPVHLDSCVEWFVNFAPKTSSSYFNFEVNANGIMNVAFRKSRHDYVPMIIDDIKQLNIKTTIEITHWSVEYTVPFSLIRKYFVGFEPKDEVEVLTNFYKCGDETLYPHYGVWKTSNLVKPDFHRPEYFGKLVLHK